MTLRRWAIEGRVPFLVVGDQRPERRFGERDVDVFAGGVAVGRDRVEVAYVRASGASGASGQESSLTAQAVELVRAGVSGIVGVYAGKAGGLRESRPGLAKLLKDTAAGRFTVVGVTHEDRPAWLGVGRMTMPLAICGGGGGGG